MNKVAVNRIIPFSSVDGPGNRTAIFLQGCNFNCLYCHNPETINHCNHCGRCVETCPVEALKLIDGKVRWDDTLCTGCHQCLKTCRQNSSPRVKLMTVDEIIEEINKTKAFISGITVSGGESTLQIPFLTQLFKGVKEMGLTTFVDTNGSIPLWEEESFLSVVDQFMVDLKSTHQQEHLELTGLGCSTVIENIKQLANLGKLYEVRTVIVPNLLDNKRNVENTSKLIASLNPEIRYKIIKYRALGVREGLVEASSPTDEMLLELKALAEEEGCRDVVLV
ncbi:YjjW family glycine radical enzyme activase [Alkaliphilus transvaalensis]|uniref:YjjW family glycine radical enzyme activase n=1 Tax=Alkaliphilus transvaalensis TaxID=114628 RepID=UPI00047D160B|nr:YjjW family glycine radical enzyme activase [Alkaliphilus transvaalensis]